MPATASSNNIVPRTCNDTVKDSFADNSMEYGRMNLNLQNNSSCFNVLRMYRNGEIKNDMRYSRVNIDAYKNAILKLQKKWYIVTV